MRKIENKNKRAVSPMIAYVLLIVIGISVAFLVYQWLKLQIPAQSEKCSEDVRIIIKSYECNQANKKIISSQFSSAVNGTLTMPITSPKLCSQLKQVSYRSHTGTYTKTYISSEYTCSGNQLTLTINGIEQATNSNTLTLGYEGDGICDSWEDSFSIDCNPSASPGGGGGSSGNYTNQTIYLNETNTMYRSLKLPTFMEWLRSNYRIILIIALILTLIYLGYKRFK